MSENSSSLISDAALGDSIMNSEYPNIAHARDQRLSAHGTELFSVQAGVQIFNISPEGYVSAPSYPTSLHVVKLHEAEDSNTDGPPAFLQVGEWFYPLIPGASPVLHTNYGAYLFPDLSETGTGMYIS